MENLSLFSALGCHMAIAKRLQFLLRHLWTFRFPAGAQEMLISIPFYLWQGEQFTTVRGVVVYSAKSKTVHTLANSCCLSHNYKRKCLVTFLQIAYLLPESNTDHIILFIYFYLLYLYPAHLVNWPLTWSQFRFLNKLIQREKNYHIIVSFISYHLSWNIHFQDPPIPVQ